MSDGVVVGSAILKAMDNLGDDATTEQRASAIRDIVTQLKECCQASGTQEPGEEAGSASH
jgi:tryptophan synthase alpha subunit